MYGRDWLSLRRRGKLSLCKIIEHIGLVGLSAFCLLTPYIDLRRQKGEILSMPTLDRILTLWLALCTFFIFTSYLHPCGMQWEGSSEVLSASKNHTLSYIVVAYFCCGSDVTISFCVVVTRATSSCVVFMCDPYFILSDYQILGWKSRSARLAQVAWN